MNEISHHPELVVSLKIGISKYQSFDFNRFRYLGVPQKKQIDKAKFANRDKLVHKWVDILGRSQEYSGQTKFGYFHDLTRYVSFTDSRMLNPESEEAANAWEQHLIEKVRLGSMPVNTAQKHNSAIRCLLRLLGYPVEKWFSPHGLFRRESNPTEAYSDTELKTLLRLIQPLFNQLFKQITSDFPLYLNAQPRDKFASIQLKGRNCQVAGAITKCFTLGYFLMSYYTWGNSTTILKMKKFKKSDLSKNIVYSQSVLKARANKYVTISIGENNNQNVPKHALRFIEKLLELSNLVAPNSDHLFFKVSRGKATSLEPSNLRDITNWLLEYFNPTDDYGKPLRPMAKRFRASGSARYLDLTGDAVGVASLLGNTPQTVSRHYTTGSPIENRKQLQAAAHTLEAVARCSDLTESKNYAKQQLDVEVLPYDEFLEKYSSFKKKPQTTIIGSGCKNPFDTQAGNYRRKMNFSPKDLDVEHLACSDILKCFSCPNQVILEEVEDIWCLMSFKEAVNDSLANHTNRQQFERNFRDLIDKIEMAIFKVDPAVRRKAQNKLRKEGRHCLWPEGINDLF